MRVRRRIPDHDLLRISLRERWESLARRNWLRDASGAFDDIVALYDRPERTYHNLTHLGDCFQKFERVRWFFRCPDVVAFALFYHDAVSVPGALDNEEQSAALFARMAFVCGLPDDFVAEVSKCILATKRHIADPAFAPDIALAVDIDLSILGAKPCHYDDYAQAIRMEYLGVISSEDAWALRRTAFIDEMLDGRPSIYLTSVFRSMFEERARANLMEERSRLQRAG